MNGKAPDSKGKAVEVANGAVMLLGSLFWEGNDAIHDGTKGEKRKKWRDASLDMASCRNVSGLPIRYGRRSSSRNGEYTIVFGGESAGVAKIVNLRQSIPLNADGTIGTLGVKVLKNQVQELAAAEGIKNDNNPRPYCDWGFISIIVNAKSQLNAQLLDLWRKNFRPADIKCTEYCKDIVDQHGILQLLLKESVWGDTDFCLVTVTKPDAKQPSAREIAEAVKLGSYFRRTTAAGIETADDKQIKRYLDR